ncbi:protein of unknown function DUF1111 [Haliangium ochraceum DSM 14365]|uniref:Cytochrome c domain-containing protein n=1 Tax=Haliangium ochraceum (strain DSM 14365 / JCM 11303 / SMP-2) TaxID=502025 RepID=D0LFU1_HALO1|nr:protein of unknown function DUF1111 [Haliangium ochraceum DSM 14365]
MRRPSLTLLSSSDGDVYSEPTVELRFRIDNAPALSYRIVVDDVQVSAVSGAFAVGEELTALLTLEEGIRSVEILLFDGDGVADSELLLLAIELPAGPSIVLDAALPATSFEESLVVSGRVDGGRPLVSLTLVSGDERSDIEVTEADGGALFSALVPLTLGDNPFTLQPVDDFGRTDEKTWSVLRSVDTEPPHVDGRDHVLAVGDDGSLWAWGLNGSSQVGPEGIGGFVDDVLSPVVLAGVDDAFAVYANGNQGFYEDGAGQLWGWGQNGATGNLGIPAEGDVAVPSAPVFGIRGVVDVAIGALHGVVVDGAAEDGTPLRDSDAGRSSEGDTVDASSLADAASDENSDASPTSIPDPLRIGGALTATEYGSRPFLTTAPALDLGGAPAVSFGRELFVADWDAAPGSRELIDGLGPLYHALACLGCHPESGRAASLEAGGSVAPGLLLRLVRTEGEGLVHDPSLGGQLQTLAIAGVPAEGTAQWEPAAIAELAPHYHEVAARAPAPRFTVAIDPAYPALADNTNSGPRLAPQLVGVGLLEQVPEDTLLAWEDIEDADGDGISGRASWVATPSGPRIGRFGWNGDGLQAVATFLSLLAVPAARRERRDPQVEEGASLFRAARCDACHRETLTTGAVATQALLSEQTFHPYTDLLLHDMGAALADPVGEGDTAAREWRTPPLWGLGLIEEAANARFLHDGRALSLEDAILWHGGEAEAARAAFAAMGRSDRDALLAFVRSL